MTMTTLEDLLVEQIRDLYDAEKQLVRALPKMAGAANSDDLQRALQSHLEETNNQVSVWNACLTNSMCRQKESPAKACGVWWRKAEKRWMEAPMTH